MGQVEFLEIMWPINQLVSLWRESSSCGLFSLTACSVVGREQRIP
jgi:hypothetical protein